MTRVLLVHQPIDGGVARHVADLSAGLRDRDFEVILCGPSLPLSEQKSARGPAAHVALPLQRAITPRSELQAIAELATIIRRLRPDLVHAHSSKAGAVARLARLRVPRTRVVYTPHGYAMAGFFEHPLERVAYREAERTLGLLTSRVIAVCEAEAELARRVTPPRRVRVVHNGLDPIAAGPADARVLELSRLGPVICTVSQLRPGKGLETLIDALPPVLDRCPSVQLVLIGDGVLRASLQARTRDRGISSSVHFLGEHPDPVAALRAVQIFVLPSWAESFPYAILEAMATGLPIIASDVGGIGEALIDRENGLLVPARRPDSLTAALLALVDDAQLRGRLGAAALSTVARRFTREAMADGVAHVYRELLG